LFLYVAGIVELAIEYRLKFGKGFSGIVVLIPLLVLAVPRQQRRGLYVLGTVLALCCAVLFARSLSLDFWDAQRMDLAWLAAGIGVGGLLAVRVEHSRSEWHIANWLMVSAAWLLALWNPAGPLLAMAPAALLGMWPNSALTRELPIHKVAGLSPAWLLFWIGMALPKSWWDSDSTGAVATAVWAFGAAITYLPKIRDLRPPSLLVALALLPLLYPWLPIWIWAATLGLLSGWAIQRSARPWHWAAAFSLLVGLMISYALHSNLQLFGWLVWGSG
jgi:hypothetical protein